MYASTGTAGVYEAAGQSSARKLACRDFFGSMYLTQIRSKAATGFTWLPHFAGAAINTIARFQKQPFFQTSPICVIYILPDFFRVGQPLSNLVWQDGGVTLQT
jgi:hypothetical protein